MKQSCSFGPGHGPWNSPLAGAGLALLALSVAQGISARPATEGTLPPQPIEDQDFDFLTDAQEKVLGTSRASFDTDCDGFSDLEEFARGTSPTLASSTPITMKPVSVGMSAHYGLDGLVHVFVAHHSNDLDRRDSVLQIGLQKRRMVKQFSADWLATHSTSRVTTDATGKGMLTVIDVSFPVLSILRREHISFFARSWEPKSTAQPVGALTQLINVDGIVVLYTPPPRPPVGLAPIPGASGSIYVPLNMGPAAPTGWAAGEICFQRSTPVGFSGPLITQEIVDANCLTGWEGYCPPACGSTVGSTYSTIDPIGLIGG